MPPNGDLLSPKESLLSVPDSRVVKLTCPHRPGVLGSSMGNYPWLADSWPTTNLVHSGKEAVNCCTTSHDTTERYYNGEHQHTLIKYVHKIYNFCFSFFTVELFCFI